MSIIEFIRDRARFYNCPVCGRSLKGCEVQVLSHEEERFHLQVTCAQCQVTFIVVVIGTPQFSWPPAWQTFLGALVFVTVAVSGLDYVLAYSRLAAEHTRSRRRVVRTGGSKPA